MTLSDYFDNTAGWGVLATSDQQGRINLAVYTTPRVVSTDVIAFVMRPRLSYRNLQSNGRAAYMYLERGVAAGTRLQLTMIRQEVRRRPGVVVDGEEKYVVYLHVDSVQSPDGEMDLGAARGTMDERRGMIDDDAVCEKLETPVNPSAPVCRRSGYRLEKRGV